MIGQTKQQLSVTMTNELWYVVSPVFADNDILHIKHLSYTKEELENFQIWCVRSSEYYPSRTSKGTPL